MPSDGRLVDFPDKISTSSGNLSSLTNPGPNACESPAEWFKKRLTVIWEERKLDAGDFHRVR